MTADDLFATLAVVVVLTGVGIAVAAMKRSGQKRFESLAPAFDFGTSHKVGLFGMTIAGLAEGYTCRYTIQPASQHNPGGASLRVSVSAGGRWSAEVANTGSRLLVKVGVLQDVEIGDPELELKLRFSADDPGALKSLFGIESVRAAIRDTLATENFSSVRLGRKGLEVRWSPRSKQLDEDADILGRRLATTTTFASACGYPPQLSF
ncbi:MAG: hypothetical protein QNL88_06960 [Acidobacteriota bacterium]|nr:hypothetical protein [Acidobacteriota bacterium]